MPLSNRIIRNHNNANLPSWQVGSLGQATAADPIDKILSKAHGTTQGSPAPKKPLTEQEQALHDWEQRLLAREQAIAELERQTVAQAEQTGQQRGYEAGWDAAHHERVALIQAAESVKNEFAAFKRDLADKVLNLGVSVAKRVLGDTVQMQPQQAGLILRQLVQDMRFEPSQLRLKAHPNTLEVLRAQFGDGAELAGITLIETPEVLTGGFVLQHPEGEIDASMETRWARAMDSLSMQAELTEADLHPQGEPELDDDTTDVADLHESIDPTEQEEEDE